MMAVFVSVRHTPESCPMFNEETEKLSNGLQEFSLARDLSLLN